MRKKSDGTKEKEQRRAKGFTLRTFWDRLKSIPWKQMLEWIFVLPWRFILRTVGRLLHKRVWKAFCFLICIGILCGILLLSVSGAVCDKTRDRILTVEELQEMQVDFDCIMVLGCRVYADGTMSHMLEDRVKTGIALYEAGVSQKLLMSGDSSSSPYYDEVGAMRKASIEAGVPEAAILTDPMGLSTYDSVARALEEYKGRRVVIVTQEFHLYRALYIAEKLGIEAYGVSADLRTYSTQLKSDIREIFARCKDVFYALKQPKPIEK